MLHPGSLEIEDLASGRHDGRQGYALPRADRGESEARGLKEQVLPFNAAVSKSTQPKFFTLSQSSTSTCCEWCGSSSVPRPFCASCGLPKLHGSQLYDRMIAASVMTGWRTMNLERAFWSEVEASSTGVNVHLISPHAVRGLLDGEHKRTMVLVLDLRPHELFTASWIIGSINLHLQTDPGQLWQIPTIPVPRSVVEEGDREKIRRWRSYSVIVVYDAHSSGYGETKWPLLVLDRFIEAGWPGIGCVVTGGFDALAMEAPQLVMSGRSTLRPVQKHLEGHRFAPHNRMSGSFQRLDLRAKDKGARTEEEAAYGRVHERNYVMLKPEVIKVGDVFNIWKPTDEVLHLSTVVLVSQKNERLAVCKIHHLAKIPRTRRFRRYLAEVRFYQSADSRLAQAAWSDLAKAEDGSQDLPPVHVIMSGEQHMKDNCWLNLRRSFDIDPEKDYIVDWCGELAVGSYILVRRKWEQCLRANRIEDNNSQEEDFGGPQDSFQPEPISQSTSLAPPQETDKPDSVIKESKDWSMPLRSKSPSHPDPRDSLPRHLSKSLLPACTSESTRLERASIAPDKTETEQRYRHDGKAFPVSSDDAAQQIQARTARPQPQQSAPLEIPTNVLTKIDEATAETAAGLATGTYGSGEDLFKLEDISRQDSYTRFWNRYLPEIEPLPSNLENQDKAFSHDDKLNTAPDLVDDCPPTHSPYTPAAVQVRQIPEVLTKASQEIGAAKILGRSRKIQDAIDAIDAYGQARKSLQRVTEKIKDREEQERPQNLMSRYDKRIVELQRSDLGEVIAAKEARQDPPTDSQLRQVQHDSSEAPKEFLSSSAGEKTDTNSELGENLLERSTSAADSEDSAGLGFLKISRQVDDRTPEEAQRNTVDSGAVNAADGALPSTGPMFTIITAATPEGEEGPPRQVKGHVEGSRVVKAAGWHLPIGVLRSTAVTTAITEDEDSKIPQVKKGATLHSSSPKDKDSEREIQREESPSANGRKFRTGFHEQNKAINFYVWMIVTVIFLPLNFVASVLGMSINEKNLKIRNESTLWPAVTVTVAVIAGSVLLHAFRELLLEWLRIKRPGLEQSTLFQNGTGTEVPDAPGAHVSALNSIELSEFNLRRKLKSLFTPNYRALPVRGARIADASVGTEDSMQSNSEDKQLVQKDSSVSAENSSWIFGAICMTWFGVWVTRVLATCLPLRAGTCEHPCQLYHHASMVIAGTYWGLVASVRTRATGVATAGLSSWVAHWYTGEVCGPNTSIDITNLLCLVSIPMILRRRTLRMLHDSFVIPWQTKVTGTCVSVGAVCVLLLLSNVLGGDFDKQVRAWVLSCAILGVAAGAGSLVRHTIRMEKVENKPLELQSGAHWTSKVKILAWTLPQQYFRRLKQSTKLPMVSYGAWYSRMLEPRLSSSHCRIRIKCACGVHIWDDYPTKWRSAALEMQEKLNSHFRQLENDSAPQQKADGARSALLRVESDLRHFSNALRRWFLRDTRDSKVDDESRQPENTPAESQSLPHYLTCYPQAGDRRPRLVQVQSAEIQADSDYFSMLRQHARSMRRSWTRFLAPRKIKAVQYVEVHLLHDNEHVDVLQSLEPQFPKSDEEYSPVDSQLRQSDALYFGPNTLLHFFEKQHDCCQYPHVVSSIPKKLKGKLSVPPRGRPMVGWGMQLVDGIDTFRLGLSGFAGLLVSSLAGIVWARVHQDVQGGSGIAQVLMYFVTFVITMHGVSEVR